MEFLSRPQAEEKMNTLAAKRQPFLFLIDYSTKHTLVLRDTEINSDEVLYDINGKTNCKQIPFSSILRYFRKFPVPYETYKRAFEHVQHHLFNGNSYLVNLTFPTKVETNLSQKELFIISKALYKVWVKDLFVVFSPERFIKIKDNTISTFPMKGTIDASLPDARERILSDEKEEAEHATIVDLLRNDLSMVASNVHVERYRYIDTIYTNEKHLLQVSSQITGTLPSDYYKQLGTILFTLLPAGSISGAPKKKTIEIIAESEIDDRGFYTGIAGYFDGSSLDSGVMIRFIEQRDNQFYFRSGGGITVYSSVEKEYQELIDKVYVPLS